MIINSNASCSTRPHLLTLTKGPLQPQQKKTYFNFFPLDHVGVKEAVFYIHSTVMLVVAYLRTM